jgi:hypothetical protein
LYFVRKVPFNLSKNCKLSSKVKFQKLTARAAFDASFFIVFLRLVPRFPVANLRMLSRLRLILSFLALARHASRAVVEATRPEKAGAVENA